jgi:hypothetical protein
MLQKLDSEVFTIIFSFFLALPVLRNMSVECVLELADYLLVDGSHKLCIDCISVQMTSSHPHEAILLFTVLNDENQNYKIQQLDC